MRTDGLAAYLDERKLGLAQAHQLELIEVLGDEKYNALYQWMKSDVVGNLRMFEIATPLPVREDMARPNTGVR